MTSSNVGGPPLTDPLDAYEAEERARADSILAAWDSRRWQRVLCTLLCCLWVGIADYPIVPVGFVVALSWLLPDIPGWSHVQRFRYAGTRAHKLLAVAAASLLLGQIQCGVLGSDDQLVYFSGRIGPPGLSMGTGDHGSTEAPGQLAALESKCLSGDVDACIAMISTYEAQGIGDAVQPLPALEKACALKQSHGCLILVQILFQAPDDAQDPQKIFHLLNRACDIGDQSGCVFLGAKYSQGKGVKKDVAAAEKLYRAACDASEPLGCYNLGGLFLRKELLDADKAIEALDAGCKLGHGRSCYSLGGFYAEGEVIAEDVGLVVRYYQDGCDSGSTASCVNLGRMYEGGEKVAVDMATAEALYGKACEAGDRVGCHNLGSLYLRDDVDKDRNLALKPLHQACRAGMSASCYRLGTLLVDDDSSQKNQDEGMRYLVEACKLKAGEACYALGIRLREVDPAKAGGFLTKACELGVSPACKPKD